MKTPGALREQLRRQWQNGATREQRLLDNRTWPLGLSIGKPGAAQMQQGVAAVREHIARWRRVDVGEVQWQAVAYRSLATPVDLPLKWVLRSAREWVAAMADPGIQQEYRLLSTIIAAVPPPYHPLLIRQRQQVLSRGAEETIWAATVAEALAPGCARGRPLRALSIAGCDSKFLERNRSLLIRLLALRFGEAVTDQGLERFLGAADEGEHWLLVAPLAPDLLPFEQLRLRSSELRRTPLPGRRLLVVENERSLYQLPELADTVAVLGAGLNLGWMQADWLGERAIAYWGDLDTWGLAMLADARRGQAATRALMMDELTFDAFAPQHAVVEPVCADPEPPTGLDTGEQALYRRLQGLDKGRLEQEFLPVEWVHRQLRQWWEGG